MKPFDLEKALAGDPVVTRDGREVTSLHLFDCEGYAHPLMGVCDGQILSWTKDGGYFDPTNYHINDLFMKSKTVVKWVILKKNGYWNCYDSKDKAELGSSEYICIGNKAHRIEWEE